MADIAEIPGPLRSPSGSASLGIVGAWRVRDVCVSRFRYERLRKLD